MDLIYTSDIRFGALVTSSTKNNTVYLNLSLKQIDHTTYQTSWGSDFSFDWPKSTSQMKIMFVKLISVIRYHAKPVISLLFFLTLIHNTSKLVQKPCCWSLKNIDKYTQWISINELWIDKDTLYHYELIKTLIMLRLWILEDNFVG